MPSNVFDFCTEADQHNFEDVRCFVTTRGGGIVIAELEYLDASSSFERVIDETSTSEVTALLPGGSDCCDLLGQIGLGMELVWIDGSNRVLWAGPITHIAWTTASVNISAVDYTAWWSWRLVDNLTFTDTDATDIALAIHESAMAIDPVENFRIVGSAADNTITTEYFEDETRPAFDLIDELAEYAIDYTAYGRTVFIGGNDFFPILPTEITDDDWVTPPSVEVRGPNEGFATRIHATGIDASRVVVTAPADVIEQYGIIDRAVNFQFISNEQDLREAADAYIETFSNPFYLNVSSNSSLRIGSSIPLNFLIAGVRVFASTEATCKKIRTLFRIQRVRYTIDGTIDLTLEPPGSTSDNPSQTAAEFNSASIGGF